MTDNVKCLINVITLRGDGGPQKTIMPLNRRDKVDAKVFLGRELFFRIFKSEYFLTLIFRVHYAWNLCTRSPG